MSELLARAPALAMLDVSYNMRIRVEALPALRKLRPEVSLVAQMDWMPRRP